MNSRKYLEMARSDDGQQMQVPLHRFYCQGSAPPEGLDYLSARRNERFGDCDPSKLSGKKPGFTLNQLWPKLKPQQIFPEPNKSLSSKAPAAEPHGDDGGASKEGWRIEDMFNRENEIRAWQSSTC